MTTTAVIITKTYTDPLTANALMAQAMSEAPAGHALVGVHTAASVPEPGTVTTNEQLAAYVPTYTMTITFDVPATGS